MKHLIIINSILPAIRLFTGDNRIFSTMKAEDYPTASKVHLLKYRDTTTITLMDDHDKKLVGAEVNHAYDRFTEYAQLVDNLPVLGMKHDCPIFRMKATVDGAVTTIELIDYDPFEADK